MLGVSAARWLAVARGPAAAAAARRSTAWMAHAAAPARPWSAVSVVGVMYSRSLAKMAMGEAPDEPEQYEYDEGDDSGGAPRREALPRMVRSKAERAKRFKKRAPTGPQPTTPVEVTDQTRSFVARTERQKELLITAALSVREIAALTGAQPDQFFRRLRGLMDGLTMDDKLAVDIVELILKDLGYNVRVVVPQFDDAARRPPPEDPSSLPVRDPVVTIMGHVDHGKTTLLDALRSTSVAAHEAGGITQHIGAFSVRVKDRRVTFLDTPGHRAFANMRQRGASVTDIVVLVVAADDGVMPQTIEAIQHAQSAGVPLLVAINKCDIVGAPINKVKEGLLRHGVQLEDYGGEVQAVAVSALRKLHLDTLIEAILLQADLMNLRGDPTGPAEGTVLESKMEKGRGAVATVLVQRGTLKPGAFVVAGTTWGRVRRVSDAAGRTCDAAGPSTPVEVVGWRELPRAGDDVIEVPTESRARDVVDKRIEVRRLQADGEASAIVRARQLKERAEYVQARAQALPQNRSAYAQDAAGDAAAQAKPVPLIIRGDSDGTVEALVATLATLKNAQLFVRVISAQVGALTEADIKTAASLGAVTMTYNMEPTKDVKHAAKVQQVPILSSRIIYELYESMKKQMGERLPKRTEVRVVGEADVLQLFPASKKTAAGLRVVGGSLERGQRFRVLRGGETVFEGTAFSLKHFKKDVESVPKGQECGLLLENFDGFAVGDKIECFRTVQIAPDFVPDAEEA